MTGLNEKNILITGGGRGIGAACVDACLEAGARVCAVSRTKADLDVLYQRHRVHDDRLLVCAADMSTPAAVEKVFQQALARFGTLHGLVQCAAVFKNAPLRDMSLEQWQSVLTINLTGAFLGLRAGLAYLETGASIVNLGSLSGVPGVEKFPGFAAYNVSKYGVWALTEMAAVEAKSQGIRINCVAPGAVDTAMLRQAAPHLTPAMGPDEVARVVRFLLSDESRAVNGEQIALFGHPQGMAMEAEG